MARVKSEAVREAILAAAATEFSEGGYLKTTINAIANRAGTAPSNVYVYFPSKLEIALAIYEPWFKKKILALEKAVAKMKTREQKIRRLVEGLLREIADDKSGYTSTLIEALATAKPTDAYSPELLLWAENKIVGMIRSATAEGSKRNDGLLSIAHLLMLIFDGVALRSNLKQEIDSSHEMLSVMVRFIASDIKAKPVLIAS